MCLRSAAATFLLLLLLLLPSSHLAPLSQHTPLASKTPRLPRNHLRGLFQIAKSFSLFQTMHQSGADLEVSEQSSGLLRDPEITHQTPTIPLDGNIHSTSRYLPPLQPGKPLLPLLSVITCFIWNDVSEIGFITCFQKAAEHGINSNGPVQQHSLCIQYICVLFLPSGSDETYY